MIEVVCNTKHGDADLDGDVDFTDFGWLGVSYKLPGGWKNGDLEIFTEANNGRIP